MSESGHIVWPSAANKLWELDYTLADSPDAEGIAVRQVRYRLDVRPIRGRWAIP